MKRTFTVKELLDLKTPFPFKPLTKDDALKGFLKMRDTPSTYSTLADNASNYFFQKKRYKTKREGLHWKPLIEWKKPEFRKRILKVIKQLYKVDTFSKFTIRDSYIRSAIRFMGWTVAQFHPSNCAILYDKYTPKHIVDFSSGWGDRCVAAMALNIDYTGFDANLTLRNNYTRMISFYKKHSTSKVSMTFKRSETVDFSKIREYDMVFTSPPFFVLEKYNKMPEYDGFLNWTETFLKQVVCKSWKHLKKGGHMCLHIPHEIGKYDLLSEVTRLLGAPDDIVDISRHSIKRKYAGKSRVLTLHEFIYVWKKP